MTSGTSRKLFFAFASLVLAFGGGAVAALRGLAELHAALHEMKERESQVSLVLTLANGVRDEYAHLAHTIILGDESHLKLYEQAHRHVGALLRDVEARAVDEEGKALAGQMQMACGELDTVFKEQIVPAVRAGDRDTIVRAHARVLEIVAAIQRSTEALAVRYEQLISDFDRHAAAVQHAAFRWALILLVGSTVFAVGVGLYIGRSVARPVSRLEAGARRIAAGDLSTRIDVHSRDEFGRLASQFNKMTVALREHQEKLVHSEKLAGIGRLAAGVAHEINNPLGVILGYARVLRRKAEDGLAEDLRIIEEEALRCRDIVEGLLDLSRPIPSTGESVDVRELVDEVVTRLSDSAKDSMPKVEVEGGGLVPGNSQRLRQVVLNLLKNAVEAAGPEGRVEVLVSSPADDGNVTVLVRDSGAGLPPDSESRMFEPFFTTKPTGTGLGLAVSQAIAEAHGGSIRARTLPTGGAEFALELPGRS